MTDGCEGCKHWTIRRATSYGNGETIENWKAPDGKGACESLGIETAHDFGCNRFMADDGDHVETTRKPGAPWHHFVMIDCPECNGKGSGTRGHRCAGTGLVRRYDDGYVGDEQTRLHPKEKAEPPLCVSCGGLLDLSWVHCPKCGTKLLKVADTEVIDSAMAGLPPEAPPAEQTS